MTYLENLGGPLLPLAVLTVAIWLAVYSVRRWAPRVWRALERCVPAGTSTPVANLLMALPSVAFGAALAASMSGEVSPVVAFYGAIAGTMAPVLHHLLKALPWVPYGGPVRDALWRKVQERLKMLGAGIVLLLAGCAPARPPERNACYAKAAADAAAAYLEQCAHYKTTRDCPAADEIEADHAKAQEACP